MAEAQPPVCVCQTTDSALSIAANVISLVTFAYVLLVGVLYQLALSRRSKSSTKDIREQVQNLRGQVNALRSLYEKFNSRPRGQGGTAPGLLNTQAIDDASKELEGVERHLSRTFHAAADSNKLSLLWHQLLDSRRRATWQSHMRVVQERLSGAFVAMPGQYEDKEAWYNDLKNWFDEMPPGDQMALLNVSLYQAVPVNFGM